MPYGFSDMYIIINVGYTFKIDSVICGRALAYHLYLLFKQIFGPNARSQEERYVE